MALFEIMVKLMSISMHRVTKRNHKAMWVEIFHNLLNYDAITINSATQTRKYFVEVIMISIYIWNYMHIEGTGIICSISAISRPLRFQMDFSLVVLSYHVGDSAQAGVSYI